MMGMMRSLLASRTQDDGKSGKFEAARSLTAPARLTRKK